MPESDFVQLGSKYLLFLVLFILFIAVIFVIMILHSLNAITCLSTFSFKICVQLAQQFLPLVDSFQKEDGRSSSAELVLSNEPS